MCVVLINANLEYYYIDFQGNSLNSKVVNFDILSARPELYLNHLGCVILLGYCDNEIQWDYIWMVWDNVWDNNIWIMWDNDKTVNMYIYIYIYSYADKIGK